MSDNPFDRYDLNPAGSVEDLTEQLRERLAEARGEEAEHVRAAWEQLTLHARPRVVAALTTFFDDAPPIATPTSVAALPFVPPPPPDAATPFVRRVDRCPPAPKSPLDPAASVMDDPLLEESLR